MRKQIVYLIFIFSFVTAFTQETAQGSKEVKQAYTIFTKEGKAVTYAEMTSALEGKKAIFFGELHDNAVAHHLELELMEILYQKYGKQLICGSEMYENDNQKAVNDYVFKEINLAEFKDSCRLWPNQETDYQPMLDFARTQNIPWIATNIPRRYASLVFKKGVSSLDSLSFKEKSWICPLPYPVDTTLSQYFALSDAQMGMGPNFVLAQAIKDATMAHFIHQSLKENSVFYHINGSYHSDYHQGILWYLNLYSKIDYSKMLTISTVTQKKIKKLDKAFKGKADFIICVTETKEEIR